MNAICQKLIWYFFYCCSWLIFRTHVPLPPPPPRWAQQFATSKLRRHNSSLSTSLVARRVSLMESSDRFVDCKMELEGLRDILSLSCAFARAVEFQRSETCRKCHYPGENFGEYRYKTNICTELTVPESQGKRSMSSDGSQEQSCLHKFKPLTPTTQSGEGPNIETSDILLCFRSTLKLADVFELTCGYQSPGALISERSRLPFARNSSSRARGDPLVTACEWVHAKKKRTQNRKFNNVPSCFFFWADNPHHSASERKPSEAIWFSPQNENVGSCEPPMISEKCVNQTAKG